VAPSPLPIDWVISILPTTTGVIVGIAVSVGAGKINVNAGKGTRVVVGVTVDEELGEKVCDGVLNDPAGDWVIVPGVTDVVTSNGTAACTGCTAEETSIHKNNM
jgi:hypothetical protein